MTFFFGGWWRVGGGLGELKPGLGFCAFRVVFRVQRIDSHSPFANDFGGDQRPNKICLHKTPKVVSDCELFVFLEGRMWKAEGALKTPGDEKPSFEKLQTTGINSQRW